MKKFFQHHGWAIPWLLLSLAGCGSATGGAEAGNPSRTITGSVPPSDAAALKLQASALCTADKIIVTDSRDQEESVEIQDDCSFTLTLASDEAHQIDFELGGDYVATMAFDNTPGRFTSPVMLISEGESSVDLDEISLSDQTAMPGREPSKQNDQDADGLPDFSDIDDDADGVIDTDEEDCDLDGIINDFDEKNTDCALESEEEPEKVLEVLPHNGEGKGRRNKVKLDQDVKARFSCEIDPKTVDASSFQVRPQDDPENPITCLFSFPGSGRTVECRHDETFLPGTIYETHLEGIRCSDRTLVRTTTWSWQTRE